MFPLLRAELSRARDLDNAINVHYERIRTKCSNGASSAAISWCLTPQPVSYTHYHASADLRPAALNEGSMHAQR